MLLMNGIRRGDNERQRGYLYTICSMFAICSFQLSDIDDRGGSDGGFTATPDHLASPDRHTAGDLTSTVPPCPTIAPKQKAAPGGAACLS
ncbi:MAG: hypothetical protein DCC74_00815 [Proteobacteria bacterium]|nr:MAG: hypothetical protein DCC74_00815 [Pseudomonadota bacterium]